ncbi:MAG: hypothetical protein AB1670_07710 [Pseudomonadota bacterium]
MSKEVNWQQECLKKGFEYVRESDDHYVVASPAEMVALLRDLLGVDVRTKDCDSYGVAACELQEQIDGLVNTIHAQQAERDALLAERDALVKDAERYRWLRMADWWDSPLCAVRNPAKQVKLGSDCPSRDRLDDAIDAALQGAQP